MTYNFTRTKIAASVSAMAALSLGVPAATAQSGSSDIRMKPITATAKPTATGCNINSRGGDPAMMLLADNGGKKLGVFDRTFKDMKGPIPVTLQFSSGTNQSFRMSPTNSGSAKITLSATEHDTLLSNIAASTSVTIINGTTKLTVPLVEAASAVSTYRSCTAMLPKSTPPPATIARAPAVQAQPMVFKSDTRRFVEARQWNNAVKAALNGSDADKYQVLLGLWNSSLNDYERGSALSMVSQNMGMFDGAFRVATGSQLRDLKTMQSQMLQYIAQSSAPAPRVRSPRQPTSTPTSSPSSGGYKPKRCYQISKDRMSCWQD